MKRSWIKQFPDTKNCGQIALAVITGLTLRNIYSLIGHTNGTKSKEIIKVLKLLGYNCPDKCKRLKNKPKLAIAKLRHPKEKSNWHWIVIDGDKIWDGLMGNKDGTVTWNKGHKITSYLPIEELMGM